MSEKPKLVDQAYIGPIVKWAQRVTFPGLQGLAIFDVLHFLIQEVKKDDITIRAAAIAFNFMLAIFPGIIFLFALIPYIPVDNLPMTLMSFLQDILPTTAYLFFEETIADVVSNQRVGLLSFGFLTVGYLATNGVNSMLSAFDKNYEGFKHRNFFQSRWTALKITMFLAILVLASILFIITGTHMTEYILEMIDMKDTFGIVAFTTLRWIVILGLYFFSMSLIFYYGPAVKKKFRFISAGSTVATLLTVVTSLGFTFYVDNFGQYNKLYGSIGTFMVVMLWFYFNALVILIGYELNASIAVNKIRKDRDSQN